MERGTIIHLSRHVAQPGSASSWGGEGREFESLRADQLFCEKASPKRLAFLFLIQRGFMRIGIAFPILVFIVAVAFLAWFVIGGYATPGS